VPMGCAGAAFNSDDTEFRDAYDKALMELKTSGEFAKIVEPQLALWMICASKDTLPLRSLTSRHTVTLKAMVTSLVPHLMLLVR
jgi:hypothetical protein